MIPANRQQKPSFVRRGLQFLLEGALYLLTFTSVLRAFYSVNRESNHLVRCTDNASSEFILHSYDTLHQLYPPDSTGCVPTDYTFAQMKTDHVSSLTLFFEYHETRRTINSETGLQRTIHSETARPGENPASFDIKDELNTDDDLDGQTDIEATFFDGLGGGCRSNFRRKC